MRSSAIFCVPWILWSLTPTVCAHNKSQRHEAYATRDYFYVGGQYTASGTSFVYTDQMYVEKLTPSCGVNQPYPIVLMHGNGQTGTNWLNKPDGGSGWGSWLLERGYEVYIIDQTQRGRSPWWPSSNTSLSVMTTYIIESRFTAPKNYNLWAQASLHTQWPGNGTKGDPIYDAYYASVIESVSSDDIVSEKMQAAGAALLDRIGPSILLSHSQSGLFQWLIADVRPSLVKAIVAIEPKGPPFRELVFSSNYTRPFGVASIPLTYDPPVTNASGLTATVTVQSNRTDRSDCILQQEPARQLVNLKGIPVLVETSEASYHALYDHCTVDFLTQAGVNATLLRLEDVGLRGNGHLQFLEKNSDDIVEVLHEWIEKALNL